MLLGQLLVLPESGFDLSRGVRAFIIHGMIAEFEVDVELGLADIDTDVEELIQLGNGRQFGSFHTGLLLQDQAC